MSHATKHSGPTGSAFALRKALEKTPPKTFKSLNKGGKMVSNSPDWLYH